MHALLDPVCVCWIFQAVALTSLFVAPVAGSPNILHISCSRDSNAPLLARFYASCTQSSHQHPAFHHCASSPHA